MSIINRRNAVVGWLALSVGKRALKKKAKDAAPSVDPETKRPNKSAVALALAGFVGVFTFWRKRSSGDDADSSDT
jgi:hypothetical protein